MKKLLPLMLVALGALTSCAGGKAVSRAEYIEEAEAVEAHEYSKATVTLKTTSTGQTIDEEDITTKIKAGEKNIVAQVKDVKEVVDVKEEYTYDAEEQEWIYAGEGESKGSSYLEMNALTTVGPDENDSEETLEGYEFTYYVDPFKVETKIDMTMEVSGNSIKMKGSTSYGFDKYGFLTSGKGNVTTTATLSEDTLNSLASAYALAGVTVDFSKVKTTTTKATLSLSISYK